MGNKPSYLGTARTRYAVAEAQAHEYLHVWADATPSEDVRKVLLHGRRAAEGEQGMSFAKRINELGYEVARKDDSGLTKAHGDREVGLAADLEKMKALKLHKLDTGDKPDIFDELLQGSLDRHPHRRAARALHRRGTRHGPSPEELLRPAVAASKTKIAGAGRGDRLESLEAKVDTLCRAVEELRQIVCAQAMPTTAA